MNRHRALLMGGVALILITVAGVVISHPVTPHIADQMKASIPEHVDYPLRSDFFDAMNVGTLGNLKLVWDFVTTDHQAIKDQIACLILFGPAIGFFIWVSTRVLPNRLMQALCTAVSLAPLSANFVGIDFYRWWALAVVTSFMVMTLVYRRYGWPNLSVGIRRAAIILMVVNAASSDIGWFGGDPDFHAALFPFTKHLETVRTIMQRGMPQATECNEPPPPDMTVANRHASLRAQYCIRPK